MNLQKAIQYGQKLLKEHAIEPYQLDAEILLLKATNLTKTELYCKPDLEINAKNYQVFLDLLAERLKFKPISKIIGSKEFYSLDFITTTDTLDPRADTETLIDACQKLLNPNKIYNFLELGTGTGCIIITLLKIFNVSRGTSRDISKEALIIAKENSLIHQVEGRLSLELANMFDGLQQKYDLIISNPPYIKTAELDILAPEVKYFDPNLALDGGADGLDYYRIISKNSKNHLTENGVVILEIGYQQATDIKEILHQENFTIIEEFKDLAGHIRCLACKANS